MKEATVKSEDFCPKGEWGGRRHTQKRRESDFREEKP